MMLRPGVETGTQLNAIHLSRISPLLQAFT